MLTFNNDTEISSDNLFDFDAWVLCSNSSWFIQVAAILALDTG